MSPGLISDNGAGEGSSGVCWHYNKLTFSAHCEKKVSMAISSDSSWQLYSEDPVHIHC